jgi:hypothetical protein
MGFFTSYGTYVAPPDEEQSKEFEQEKKLRKDAVQAGYDKASLFGDAAKEYEKFMRQGMQAQGQLTPRVLQGASAFGSPGGAALVAAEGIAPTITAAQSQLGMSGTDKILGANVGQADATRDASEYAMSAMDSVLLQQKVLGYMDLFMSYRNIYDDEESLMLLRNDLRNETNPEVRKAVQRQLTTVAQF